MEQDGAASHYAKINRTDLNEWTLGSQVKGFKAFARGFKSSSVHQTHSPIS
jgi:hypothetical protein